MGGEIVQLDIPFYSQHANVTDAYWQERACGPASLLMAMDYYRQAGCSLDDIIKEGVELGGFGPSGWVHDILLKIAQFHGYSAKREEFRSSNASEKESLTNNAITKFRNILNDNKPIIISAVKNFSEEKKFHLIVLAGYKDGTDSVSGFYYHDPDSKDEKEGLYKFVDIETFKKYFRGLAMYIDSE